MSERLFGASVRRREDARLVTGHGRYVADLTLPGMLHVAVHRSPQAHARVVKVDAQPARGQPGVKSVLLPADVAALGRLPLLVPHASLTAPVCAEILPQDVVSYAGQPVALVVAQSPEQAEDALGALRVEYATLPAVASLDDALRPDGPRVHPGGNVAACFTQRVGDPAGALTRADVVVKERFRLHRGAGMAMETRAIVARWEAELRQLTVWSTTQMPQLLRRLVARFLGLPEHAVRVVTQDIGGGFGPKGIVYPEDILVPFLARALGQPVRFVESRREHLLAVTQERDQWHEVELALTRDGQIVALRDTFVHDCGAFVSWGIIVPLITSVSVPGPYRVPNYEVTFTALYTNRVPVTPVRGAGRPQAVFVMERMLDLAAERLGLDRVAMRARNLIQPSEFPYDVGLVSRDGGPRRYDSGNYPECLRRLSEAVGWEGLVAEGQRARADGRWLGVGLALFVEDTGLGPWEGIRVRVDPAGQVFVFSGASSQGQSHETTLAQIVADGLSVPLDRVTVVPGDTAGIPYGVGTFASRIAVLASASAAQAAAEVRRKALAVAASQLEAAPADLVLDDGRIGVRGAPGRGLSLAEVATIASTPRPGYAMPSGQDPGLEASAYAPVSQSTYSSGAHAAVVEVDAETGAVRILRYVAVDDCGVVINPMIVEGQVHGGIAHGVGNALLEEVVYDGAGQLATGSLMDYALPRADQVPRLEVHHVVTPSPLNPLGVKGAGEGGTLPAPAAIANAVADALRPLGVAVTEIPLTSRQMWQCLRAARARRHAPSPS
ncbi:MAG TPA: xanthine dehydrogenase family protein molybdopterin-binding subunit [Methylomirabilota bacterium]|nr:xanthine dehydrogenase family protein molybdopterin-binding subunit [Methylomirabilota bacterium]